MYGQSDRLSRARRNDTDAGGSTRLRLVRDNDLHVMIQRGQGRHQALEGDFCQLIVLQGGNLWLAHAKEPTRGISSEVPVLENLIQRVRQPQLRLATRGVGEAKISEHVSSASSDWFSPAHASTSHKCSPRASVELVAAPFRRPPVIAGSGRSLGPPTGTSPPGQSSAAHFGPGNRLGR